ncbi:lipocalin family protein [Pseudorhodobacter turbinis]|uniref:Lipocalin family protein n=1 Tax=Pseudorhodobacter turbinis TaxID=2500533 RepID=A0A4P8EHD6_9RHOB|nr:lipocalin family protein [Pseudorhodobacter turbinis]QCO56356.1 lipocalin family protein [Pseudorhodobacter turbinis]
MYRLIALCFLVGCVPSTGFRDPGAQIYSNAVLEDARLIGDWVQVAEFAAPDAAPCQLGHARITQGLRVEAQLCLNGVQTVFSGPLVATGPGRFVPPQGEAWWVLWADVGYRTIAIGTPSGRFGFILNRGPIAPDRMRAAQEVLAWNGYTTARLR